MPINPTELHECFMGCFYTPEERATFKDHYQAPENAAKARNAQKSMIVLHPERVEALRPRVAAWLLTLPDAFFASKGGGWSFLNACTDRDNNQWTGDHMHVDQLFVLGIMLNLAFYSMEDMSLWSVFPGGLPYITVRDDECRKAVPA